jgi:hypothetical protein
MGFKPRRNLQTHNPPELFHTLLDSCRIVPANKVAVKQNSSEPKVKVKTQLQQNAYFWAKLFPLEERKIVGAEQSIRGQAFLLVIFLLAGTIAAVTVLSAGPVKVRYAPTVQEAFWKVDGQTVTTASMGNTVNAHVMIKAVDEYVGSVVVKIRKDLVFWFDSDFYVLTVPVNLVGGQEKEIELALVPDKPSQGRLRGYFIEIDFEITKTKWVMENSYPPRLRIT